MKISNKLVALWSNNEPLFLGKCIYGIKTDRTCFYMEIIGDCCMSRQGTVGSFHVSRKKMLKLFC